MNRRLVLWIGILTLTWTAPARAQEPAPIWFGGLFFEADFFSGSEWTDWSAIRGLATLRVERATLGLEAATVSRFGLRDESVAAEAYVDLWPGAYAHVRAGVAPGARVVPLSDWRLELFHSLPGAWEASANLSLMNVSGPDVTVVGGEVAHYVREWYLRGRASVAGIAGTKAGAGAVFARRFLRDDSREYVEAGAGLGSEIVVLGAGPLMDARDTWFLAASLQMFVREPFGIHVGAGLNDFEGVPLRRHLTVGLIARF